MESQFPHIEGYGRRASTRKNGGKSMLGIAYEAERRPGFCDHVSAPRPPKILYGCMPSAAAHIAADRAEQAVDADGKKLRIDALVFLGGVASYPARWENIRNNKEQEERLRKWLGYLVEFLKRHYDVTLHYILLHIDEPYPHVHWGCVPPLDADGRMRFSNLHPGRAAYDRTRAAGATNRAGRKAYKDAMTEWQNTLHIEVYAKVGIDRIGPRRQRLTAEEYKARQTASGALARTLAAEAELKATWRKQIRAELLVQFSAELMGLTQNRADLTASLTVARDKIVKLESRVAELEACLEPPSPEEL
jgi:hypothetical protein